MLSTQRKVLVIGLCGWMASAAAFSGHYYEAVTSTQGGGPGGNSEMTVVVWVDGDSTKIQFAEGDKNQFFGPGTYMVTTDAGENLYLVNDNEQTYSQFNLGQMANAVGQAMEGVGGMIKMEFDDFYSEKVSQSGGESILGYDTEHVRFRSGYTMRMSVMGMKQMQKVDMDQEVWVTEAFDPRAFMVWLRPDKRLGGMFEGLDEMMEQQFSTVSGVPLRAVINTTTTDKKGRTTTSVTRTEVIALREEAVSASTFQIPAGYQEIQLMPDPATLEAMQGQGEGEEEGRRRPRLRDLLKKRGGDG